jgi:DNA-binding NtrC family response regulator
MDIHALYRGRTCRLFCYNNCMRVLVVDDEQLVRWFLERALKKWGHEVVTADSSRVALTHFETSSFDVMFTDLRMPEENGANLIEKIKDENSKLKIVVCSAFVTNEMAEDFKRKGILTIKKPFRLSELEETLKRCYPQE